MEDAYKKCTESFNPLTIYFWKHTEKCFSMVSCVYYGLYMVLVILYFYFQPAK